MALQEGGGKAVTRAKWSGRRRPVTRRSGYTTHGETTGGEFKTEKVSGYSLKKGEALEVKFRLPAHAAGDLLAYGGWFCASPGISITVLGGPPQRTLTAFRFPNWNKFGSIFRSNGGDPILVQIRFSASAAGNVSLSGLQCGVSFHEHLTTCRAVLLDGLEYYAPEAIFVTTPGQVEIVSIGGAAIPLSDNSAELIVKSCNRCGRYLPINFPEERNHLSFSNHCTREDLIPCKHGSFGTLKNPDNSQMLQLENGFQLECRFCKRYTVNGQHNPKRNAAQMKEDAHRRRAFELLLAELYGANEHLQYRIKTGRELVDVVWERFGGKCFKCGEPLSSQRAMHLDHTRPLAMLWPLDETATALCATHNSEKRDRAPVEYYSTEELGKLSEVTGIPISELENPSSNKAAIDLLLGRLDWFFDDFLARPELAEDRDGKITGELLVKALDKALGRYPGGAPVKLMKMYHERRG